jgi:hypothetical protein
MRNNIGSQKVQLFFHSFFAARTLITKLESPVEKLQHYFVLFINM